MIINRTPTRKAVSSLLTLRSLGAPSRVSRQIRSNDMSRICGTLINKINQPPGSKESKPTPQRVNQASRANLSRIDRGRLTSLNRASKLVKTSTSAICSLILIE
jgi:hypothetical protein